MEQPMTASPEGPGWVERELQPVMAMLAHKWVLAVLASLADGPRRRRDLRGSLPGISDKVLTATLRRLEREGLVRRDVYATSPVRVEYILTSMGHSMQPSLASLAAWVAAHRSEITEARSRYDEAARARGDSPSR
jgi:DNA-binding HxlR family transcriptional regulator